MVFIKRSLIIFFICLVIFSLMGCKNRTSILDEQTQLDSPPTLKILYQDKSIDAIRGTYSWTVNNDDGSKTTKDADCSAPPELVKGSDPLTVSPNSLLALSFSDKPTDITVNIWKDNQSIKQTITDNTIVTLELKGIIIYEVIGTWIQGTVSYAFLVYVD